jgi:hypothetical protein
MYPILSCHCNSAAVTITSPALIMVHASMPSEGLARIKNILYFDSVSAQHAELYDSVRSLTYTSAWFLSETTGRIFTQFCTTPISDRYI